MEKLKISPEKIQENPFSKKDYQIIDSPMKNCEKHGEYPSTFRGMTGRVLENEICPGCFDDRIKEEEKKKIEGERRDLIDGYHKQSNVPKRFQNMNIEDINLSYHKKPEDNEKLQSTVKIVKRYLTTYPERLEKGASGFFCGECGTGKTMLACMMVESIINQGYSAHYITAWQMIQEIRKGYRKDEESISDYINGYIKRSFLAIDEVGVQHGTDDERILLYQVIDGRYNEVKPTIIISNSMNPVEDGYLDLRTIDRLKDGGGFSITFNGESFRK